MDRAYTRYRRAVALVRKRNIVHYWWHDWEFLYQIGWRDGRKYPWQSDRVNGAHGMNEPGWWVHDRMTVPARRREQELLRAIRGGADADSIQWPDNRKPHDYYW